MLTEIYSAKIRLNPNSKFKHYVVIENKNAIFV